MTSWPQKAPALVCWTSAHRRRRAYRRSVCAHMRRNVLVSISAGLLLTLLVGRSAAAISEPVRPEIMVVGVAHLVAERDLHNATWGRSVSDPIMQAQIARMIRSIARFAPTKVMIEANATDPVYRQRYEAYRRGTYVLGANEDDQFGYRLAKIADLPTIYPIDSVGNYPFDYDSVTAAARRYHQQNYLSQADSSLKPLTGRSSSLERQSRLIDLLRYLNTPAALRANRGWYLFINRIGASPPNDAGARLASFWYARNAEIFANIARNLQPGDRVVVFIGQGHAAMLRPMIDSADYVTDVDPEPYL